MFEQLADWVPFAIAGFVPPAEIAKPRFEVRAHTAGDLLELALAANRPEVAGVALVNRCIDDLLEVDAAPHCFAPCLSFARADRDVAEGALLGVEQGCRAAGIRLFAPQVDVVELDGQCHLSGTMIGVESAARRLPQGAVRAGDVVIGLGSTGLHSQGHALALRALQEQGFELRDPLPDAGATVAALLLALHKSYRGVLRDLLLEGRIGALAHVDAGGLTGALERVLPEGLGAHVELGAWPLPPLFAAVLRAQQDGFEPLCGRLNMGLGMLLFVAPDSADAIAAHLSAWAEPHWRIGRVETGERRAVYHGVFAFD